MPLPPYQARPYDDRGRAASMSQLIRDRGRSEAEALRRDAQIRMGLANNLGQIAGNTMADLARGYQQQKADEAQAARQAELDKQNEFDRAQQRQVRDLQIRNTDAEMAQRGTQQREQGLFQGALQEFTTVGEDGKPRVDWDKAEARLVASKAGHLVGQMRTYRNTLEKTGLELQQLQDATTKAKTQAYATAARGLRAMGGDKDVVSFGLAMGTLRDIGAISEQEMQQIYQQVEDAAEGDPEKAAAEIQRLIAAAEAAAGVKPEKPRAGFNQGDRSARFEYDENDQPVMVAKGPLYGVREPKGGGGSSTPDITPSVRAAAERWKEDELKKAEDAFAQGFYARPQTKTEYAYEPTPEQQAAAKAALERRKAEIQRSYLEQIQATGPRSAGPPAAAPGTAATRRQSAPQTMTLREAQQLATLTGRTLAEVEAQAKRDGILIR